MITNDTNSNCEKQTYVYLYLVAVDVNALSRTMYIPSKLVSTTTI